MFAVNQPMIGPVVRKLEDSSAARAKVQPERYAGEIVLGVKETTSNGAGDQMREDQRQQKRGPAEAADDDHRQREVPEDREQAVIMFSWPGDEGIETHAMEKHEDVPEQNGQGMTHEQVIEAHALRRLRI